MILVDLHAHSGGISTCCRVGYERIIDDAKETGIGGIVLTNHYVSNYVIDDDYDAFARAYLEEYAKAKAYGDSVGVKVFFGVEVTAEWDKNVHLLAYGVPHSFVTDHPRMCLYSLEELYRTVHAYGGILVQAHPYRVQPRLQDLAYLDGVEISCHPHLRYCGSFASEMKEIAEANRKLLTCGGDYHADVAYRPQCGVFVPKEISGDKELADWLMAQERLTLRVHEPGGDWQDLVYQKT